MPEVLKVKVAARENQGADVAVLTLCAVNEQPLPPFTPGAHIDLYLNTELIRQYSLCSSARDNSHYRVGILKDPSSRGGSLAAHALNVGDELDISLPRNMFPLDMSAKHSILIGGGIGITPMLTMADTLYHNKSNFEMHYCGRSRTRIAFLDEITKADWSDNVHLHFDDESDAQKLDPLTLFKTAPAGTHVYVCGPEGFMTWILNSATSAGLQEEQVHKEFFNKSVETDGESFQVEIPELNVNVKVNENQTIVQALAEAGVRVKVSCEQGVCGTCLANVIEGEPDHRDSYLTDDEKSENDQIILCCSRAKSKKLIIEVFEVE